MKPIDLAVVALGIGCAVLGHYLPDVREFLLFIGGGLVGTAGFAKPSTWKAGGAATPLALLVGLELCLSGRPALADANNPLTGACLAKDSDGVTCTASVHASAVAPAAALNLATGKLAAGTEATALGPCYGVTYKPTSTWASGADLCVLLSVGQAQPNKLGAALMLHLTPLLSAGIGVIGTEAANGGLQPQWSVYLAPRLPVQ